MKTTTQLTLVRSLVLIGSRLAALCVTLALVATAGSAWAQTETVLYSFTGGSDGPNPYAALIQATDGNFYGTTFFGGAGFFGGASPGVVFKVTPGGLKLTRMTAQSGQPSAQYRLGRMYENGSGVRESSAQAAKWYRKAAEQGFAPAQCALGRLHASGEGVRQDNAEALRWFAKAAAQDYALAMNRLGLMYERGQGVPKDYVQAYKWFILAAGAEQNVFGVANQEVLARRMTPQQIQEAQRLAEAALAHSSPALAAGTDASR
jgi:hypothetical protein